MSKARGLADLGNAYSDGALSNRNMVINGGYTISQRYGAAASNLSGSSVFAVDRFNCFGPSASSTSTAQQVTDTPAGFKNSLKYSCGTGLAVTGSDYAQITQILEGNNTAHLKWGTADAQDVTVSFWAKSSLTGTFSFHINNGAQNRSYVAQYTIAVANTWEYKTISVSGDTSGTWPSDNTAVIRLVWDMGFGSGVTATVDTWQAGSLHYVAGNVKVNETSGATFFITGVQLEVGDTATPFEHRSYGQELALCHRYYWLTDDGPAASALKYTANTGAGQFNSAISAPTTMRAVPTITIGGTVIYTNAGALTAGASVSSITTRVTPVGTGTYRAFNFTLSMDAEL
jgi:hypothetical protein